MKLLAKFKMDFDSFCQHFSYSLEQVTLRSEEDDSTSCVFGLMYHGDSLRIEMRMILTGYRSAICTLQGELFSQDQRCHRLISA